MDNKLIIGLAVLAGAALILSNKKKSDESQDEEIITAMLYLDDLEGFGDA